MVQGSLERTWSAPYLPIADHPDLEPNATNRLKFQRNQIREHALIMVFKLIMSATKTWRRLNEEKQVPKAIEGVKRAG